MGDGCDCSVGRVKTADFSAAAGKIRFKFAIEMIDVGATSLEFPRDFGVRQAAREENLAVGSPCRNVRAAAARFHVAIAGGEPHRLAASEDLVLRAIRTSDADIGPVVAGILSGETIDVQDPATVRRPARPEVKMTGLRGDSNSILPFKVGRPDLVSLTGREVEGDPFLVGTEAETVWQSFARGGEFAGIAAVQADSEKLADILANDLDQESVIVQEQRGSDERGEPVLVDDFGEGSGLKVVHPNVRRRLRVVFGKRFAGSVASRFHAEEEDAATV